MGYDARMDTLKVARVRAGFTQAEVAAVIEVDYPTLWRWEAGRSNIPAWAFLRLAELYGVDCRAIEVKRVERKTD